MPPNPPGHARRSACEHPGCPETELLDAYAVPGAVPAWYCAWHATARGFCWSCKGFFGGTPACEFGNPLGLCEDCFSTLEDAGWHEEYPS
jgi:hypothetical protein